MHFKILSRLLLAVTILAHDTNSSYDDYMNSLSSLVTDTEYTKLPATINIPIPTDLPFESPPSSIVSVLITAIPPAYFSQLGNPASRSSIFSEIHAGHYPSWYSDLPADVKTYIATAYRTGWPKETGAGDSTTMATATDSATATASAIAETTGPKHTGSKTSTRASQGATSEAGAAQTGVLAVGLVGAAGILGLAVGL